IGKFQGEVELTRYDILFDGSVTGLQVDGTVRYRGIAVGHVTDIRIDPENIEKIRVTIEVKADTPVRTDTVASIEVQGITGGTYQVPAMKSQAYPGETTRALTAATRARSWRRRTPPRPYPGSARKQSARKRLSGARPN